MTPTTTAATSKTCTSCHTEQPLDHFAANPRMHDGRSSWCRRCHNQATQDWRARNRDYIDQYNAARRVAYHENKTRKRLG